MNCLTGSDLRAQRDAAVFLGTGCFFFSNVRLRPPPSLLAARCRLPVFTPSSGPSHPDCQRCSARGPWLHSDTRRDGFVNITTSRLGFHGRAVYVRRPAQNARGRRRSRDEGHEDGPSIFQKRLVWNGFKATSGCGGEVKMHHSDMVPTPGHFTTVRVVFHSSSVLKVKVHLGDRLRDRRDRRDRTGNG